MVWIIRIGVLVTLAGLLTVMRVPLSIAGDEVTPAVFEDELLEIPDEDEEVPKPGRSVMISESFGFGSSQNIDGFLGDYERGFSADDQSYDGSRSDSPKRQGLPF